MSLTLIEEQVLDHIKLRKAPQYVPLADIRQMACEEPGQMYLPTADAQALVASIKAKDTEASTMLRSNENKTKFRWGASDPSIPGWD